MSHYHGVHNQITRSVLLTASVTGCAAIPDHAPGKQLIHLVPSLIGKDSGALAESLGQPHDAVWINDTKHMTWHYLQLIGECTDSQQGPEHRRRALVGTPEGCHYLEAKIKELYLKN